MSGAVALLRGVGGATALKMAELREVATGIGLSGVTTLQVAGNVVFEDRDVDLDEVPGVLRSAMSERFGHDLAVIVRTHAELMSAVARNPYLEDTEGRLVSTYFLEDAPAPDKILALDPNRSPGDEFAVDGAELYVRYPNGQARSKLLLPWFEKNLGVVGTARNANTVAKLVDLTR